MGSTPHFHRARLDLPNLSSHFPCLVRISLGVDLRHVSGGVPQDDLGSFKAKFLADRSRGRVPQLIRRPALRGLPSLEFE